MKQKAVLKTFLWKHLLGLFIYYYTKQEPVNKTTEHLLYVYVLKLASR